MPLMPMDPNAGGALAPPPPGMGAPAGLMAPPMAPQPPAADAAMALAGLAQQQQAALDAMRIQTIQTAMAAVAGMPNEAAAAAQTEPGPMVAPQGAADPNAPMGAGGY